MSNGSPTSPNQLEGDEQVNRRNLLRGGAIAASAGVAVAVLNQPKASAADGDPLIVGASTTAASSTVLRMNGNPVQPGLTIDKVQGGPQLRLTPTPFTADLDQPGDLQVTPEGPIIALDDGAGNTVTDYLATGFDLDQVSSYQPVPPRRLLDTRTAAGRQGILQTSPSAFDSAYRLKAGAWIDLPLGSTNDVEPVEAAFVNIAAIAPVTSGWLAAYPSGPRPAVSSVNFTAKQNVANGLFVATGLVGTTYAIRLYTAAVTHITVDLAGLSVLGPRGVPSAQPAVASRTARRSPARRIVRARQLKNLR